MNPNNLFISFSLFLLLTVICCNKVDNNVVNSSNTTTPNNPNNPNNPTIKDTLSCGGCKEILVSKGGTSVYYHLPNSFTPNNDGRNDMLRLIHKGIKDSLFRIYIMNANHDTVKTLTLPTQTWDGKDKTGTLLPAGDYPTRVNFITIAGDTIRTSVCISIMQYNGSCIQTNGKKYCFEDQIDYIGASAAPTYPTAEKICP